MGTKIFTVILGVTSNVIFLGLFLNNNEKFRSFKSKENIHKKEVGPYRGFSY